MTFPFEILDDWSTKLKAAEAAEISKPQDNCRSVTLVNSLLSRDECQQTAALMNGNQCEQTLPSVQRGLVDSLLQSEVDRLKRMVADLTYENNRYHLALSNCHCSTLDDSISDVPAESLDISIRASTPLSRNLPSSDS